LQVELSSVFCLGYEIINPYNLAYQLTKLYELPLLIQSMSSQDSIWDKMVHASFRKVVTFDLICMGIGASIGGFTVAGILLS